MPGFFDSIRRFPLQLALILAAALIIRIVYLLIYASLPEWSVLSVDNYYHLHWAEDIAAGNVFGDTTYFRAPFYVYCLALIDLLFGPSLLAPRIFGLLTGLASVTVTYLIARRMFSDKIAIVAASFQAIFPTVFYFESEILLDALFMFLLELSLYRYLIWRDFNSHRHAWWLGVVAGLAAITRPIVLIFAPLILLCHWLDKRGFKPGWSGAVMFLAGLLVVILPISIRNVMVGGEPVLIAAQGGINFFIGNNSQSDGLSASLPEPLGHNWQIKDITYIAEKEAGRKLKPGEVSSYWFGRTFDEITQHPVAAIKLFIKKIYFNLSNREISNNRNLADFFNRHPMIKFNPLSFALIFGLAVMAIMGGWKSHSGIRLLAFIIVVYVLAVSLFFYNSRFRLPILPLYFIIAAAGIETLLYRLRPLSKSLFSSLLVGLAAFLLSFLPVISLPAGISTQHLISRPYRFPISRN
jgi:4-amino-4-deoxy-L-arabinose transferase-like glycosyltransferase